MAFRKQSFHGQSPLARPGRALELRLLHWGTGNEEIYTSIPRPIASQRSALFGESIRH